MLGVIIALTVIIALLLRGCDPAPVVSDEQHTVDSLVSAQRLKDSIYRITLTKKNDSLIRAAKRGDSLSNIADKIIKALEVSKANVALLIAKSYAEASDTTKCCIREDSLRRENIFLLENVSDYQRAQETLVANNKQLIETQQRVIEIKDSAYADVKGQLDFLTLKFSKLDYNYQKNNKKLTNSKTLNKILAGIAIVTTGILIKR